MTNPAASATHATSLTALAAHAASPKSTGSASSGLAGAHPAGEKAVTPGLAAQSAAEQFKFATLNSALANGSTSLPLSPAAPATTAPAAPHPSYYIATGEFTGYIYDAETNKPVVGATVEAFGANGQDCPATTCLPVSSTTNGSYSVYGPAGFDYVRASASYYLDNLTYSTTGNGSKTALGTMYLVETAIGVGVVKAKNPPSFTPLSGVLVTDAPTDSAYLVNPGGSTLSNGSFKIALAPAPSIVTFTPPPGLFIANWTWANATPGEYVNLGTFFLERQVEVKINLSDALTGGPLNGGNSGSLQICSMGNGCGETQQGVLTGDDNGPAQITTLAAFAAPGPSYAVIQVTGYVESTPILGSILPWAGHIDWLSPVNLTPIGAINVTVGMSGNDLDPLGVPAHTGIWTVTSCTMDGYSIVSTIPSANGFGSNTTASTCGTAGCLSIGQTATIAAVPLRDEVTIDPDTTGLCNNGVPDWVIPGNPGNQNPDVPVWVNQTWVNVTPDLITNAGWLNFTAGTYVYGNVTVQGTSSAPKDFAVSISSINYPNLATYPWDAVMSPWATWACGTHAPNEFCAAAPPGPDLVTISSFGYPNNFTWVATPEAYIGSPAGVPLAGPENEMLSGVNLTAGGFVTGNVTSNGTTFGLPLAAVEVCSVSPGYPVGCADGAASLLGKFQFPAPLGWDYIKVSASGYQADFVWAYVNGSGDVVSIGNVPLLPLATLSGRVIDPEGSPVLGATAVVCALTSLSDACPNLGAGRVSSSGEYLGSVIGGWLPLTTYRVVVSAAGYSTNWAWANATAGQQTNVSTLVLYPSGSNGSSTAPVGDHLAAGSGSNVSNVATWLTARLVDNSSGIGVQTGNYEACPASGGPCVGSIQGSNSGGYLNLTIPAGLYFLNTTATGYQVSSVYFNSSGAGYLNLGTIYLDPLPWVFGNVTINPWQRIWVNIWDSHTHENNTYSMTMGPDVNVQVCTVNMLCAPATGTLSAVQPSGEFQVWGEVGVADSVQVTPSAPAFGSSAAGGFTANSTSVSIPSGVPYVSIPGQIGLNAFAAVSFSVWNNISWENNSALTPTPIRFADVSISATGNFSTSVSWSANGSGGITFFIPPGNAANKVTYASQVPDAWEYGTAPIAIVLQPGEGYQAVQNLSLLHFGWETGLAVTTNTYQPASYLGVSAISTPSGSILQYTSTSQTNGGGFFNVSAAQSRSVQFQIGPGNDFNQTVFYAPVNFSSTGAYHSLTQIPNNLTVDHWGYVASTQVNYSAFPPIATLIDPVKDLPIPGVTLTVSSNGNTESSTTPLATSNVGGEFLVDGPPGLDWANYSRPVYEPNSTRVLVAAGEVTTQPTVNLTGDGVVSAVVLSEPGNVPVAGANITDCLGGQRLCGMSQTNGTGVFWVNATPGSQPNFINVSAPGFISTGPTLADVCSDCFVPLTPIKVYQPAYISGVVLGLPAGFPLHDANVSACSPVGGSPTGPCLYTVQTEVSGSFLIDVPAGSYILNFTDPYYNASYLNLHVVAGEHISVGTVFLESYGSAAGAVYDNATTAPISNAQVYACPVWSGGTCVPTRTDASGHYLIEGAPGAYVVTISAPGYEDSLVDLTIVGGKTTLAPTAFLVRLGVDTDFPVSGTVLAGGAGLAGALVAAEVGGVVAASTTTGSSGAFSFSVVYGTYDLIVTSPGEATLSQPVVVHGAVSGLELTLSVQTYAVAGKVTDGLTGTALSGVEILDGSSILATTGANGEFVVQLPNGTAQLTALYEGPLPVTYGQVSVAVSLDGAGLTRNVTMYPPMTSLFGLVVDSVSGAPLPGAAVTVAGTATDGDKISQVIDATQAGNFQIALPEGTYTVTGVYGGYSNGTLTVALKGASAAPVTVQMQSLASSNSNPAPSPSTEWVAIAVVLGVVAAVGVIGMVVVLRRSGRLGAPRPPTARGKE
ncbi:MAG: carboxypeptidase regulatory-like domain-containing protein [Thermoplasmata archaeon]|nr:carboxypeptidase regulatory-like domain-containing protein [Thermoplasmata archaeon]